MHKITGEYSTQENAEWQDRHDQLETVIMISLVRGKQGEEICTEMKEKQKWMWHEEWKKQE